MHVITNFEARAGAEGMLSRLLLDVREPTIVVSLRNIADHFRPAHPLIAYHALGARGPVSLLRAAWRLARLVRRERPRAVMAWMYHAMLVATVALRAARVSARLVWMVRQSLDEPRTLSRSVRLALLLCRPLSHLPDQIAYNSRRARTLHAAAGFFDGRGTHVPNGFRVPKHAEAPTRARVFGLAGRLNPQKDHATFLRAAALADDGTLRFRLAGAGTDRLEGMIRAAGLRPDAVEGLGEIADMDGFYEGIDVLVLSSRTEGFPNVVAEAMLHARPVVTTDVGDAALIVGDAGAVVPSGDAEALAAAMRALRDDPDRVRRLGERARERASARYGLPSVLSRYRALLEPDAPTA